MGDYYIWQNIILHNYDSITMVNGKALKIAFIGS